jgi:hypothetical protein
METQFPRCPFTAAGVVVQEAMPACPGFRAEALSSGDIDGRGAGPEVMTCAHLGAERLSRGRYIAACHHPEAAWVAKAAETVCRGSAIRAEAVARGAAEASPRPLLERARRAQIRAAMLCGSSRALMQLSARRRRAA